MSLARIRMQLEKWKLSGEDELSIGVTPIGPYLFFGDSTGDNMLIAFEADVSRCFNQIHSGWARCRGRRSGAEIGLRSSRDTGVLICCGEACGLNPFPSPSSCREAPKLGGSAGPRESAGTGGCSSPKMESMGLCRRRKRRNGF